MELNQMIIKRKSVRSYTGEPVSQDILCKIQEFSMVPLYSDIKVRWKFVTREQVKCLCPWTTPQLIAIYSEKKDGYLENVGFMFQQMDLYLQSLGLGSCWLGMGRMSEKISDDFVIMIAFGYPKGNIQRSGLHEFKRKALFEISDTVDERLESARLAPSSVNSQPWFFFHEGEIIHTYCVRQGILKKALGDMNRIDIGIALAHLYVTFPDKFRFLEVKNAPERKGFGYIGSISL